MFSGVVFSYCVLRVNHLTQYLHCHCALVSMQKLSLSYHGCHCAYALVVRCISDSALVAWRYTRRH